MATAVVERTSLYEEPGGRAAIAAVVKEFYARVLADAALAPMFAGVDLDRLRRHQAAFLIAALGGPNEYRGRGMRQPTAGLNITAAQFGAVAGHLADALAACGVPALTIATVIGQVAELQGDEVGRFPGVEDVDCQGGTTQGGDAHPDRQPFALALDAGQVRPQGGNQGLAGWQPDRVAPQPGDLRPGGLDRLVDGHLT
jgi:hemoglobin